MVASPSDLYRALCQVVRADALPTALVDLDALDDNIERLTDFLRGSGKTLRVASKSVRCIALLRYIQSRAPDIVRGTMCYSAREAGFLAEQGFDDLLLAYPTLQPSDTELIAETNRTHTLSVVVDCIEHIDAVAESALARDSVVPVLIEMDGSYRPLSGAIHIGVRRSPLVEIPAAVRLARYIRDRPGVGLRGFMMYEAQIAGLGDANPFQPALNPAKTLLRRASRAPVAHRRAQLKSELEACGFSLAVVNGGGTGSLSWAARESCLTELTAGSGFLNSHLFDYYQNLSLRPALFFALQVTRRPAPGFITCQSGGYIASGPPGPDRLPLPFLPERLRLTRLEGAGEVQTPLAVPDGVEISLGAPIFFRPSKTGELAEHFNEYVLFRGDSVVDRVPTYRGMGQNFG